MRSDLAISNSKVAGIAFVVGSVSSTVALFGLYHGVQNQEVRPLMSWLIGIGFWLSIAIGMLFLLKFGMSFMLAGRQFYVASASIFSQSFRLFLCYLSHF